MLINLNFAPLSQRAAPLRSPQTRNSHTVPSAFWEWNHVLHWSEEPHHHELVTAWSVSLFCAFHIAHCPTLNRFSVNGLLGEWDLPIMTSKRLGTGHVISEEDSRDSEVTTCMTAQSCLTLWDPQRLQPARLLCPWNSPGKNTGMGSHALLQGIFPTPGIEPRSLALAGRFSTTEPREKPRVAMPLNNMWPEN